MSAGLGLDRSQRHASCSICRSPVRLRAICASLPSCVDLSCQCSARRTELLLLRLYYVSMFSDCAQLAGACLASRRMGVPRPRAADLGALCPPTSSRGSFSAASAPPAPVLSPYRVCSTCSRVSVHGHFSVSCRWPWYVGLRCARLRLVVRCSAPDSAVPPAQACHVMSPCAQPLHSVRASLRSSPCTPCSGGPACVPRPVLDSLCRSAPGLASCAALRPPSLGRSSPSHSNPPRRACTQAVPRRHRLQALQLHGIMHHLACIRNIRSCWSPVCPQTSVFIEFSLIIVVNSICRAQTPLPRCVHVTVLWCFWYDTIPSATR